mmetsp:Transcript_10564/g.32950  ORF Transcript_10564/g.32950 Transcript_10564/m.32950 type:complete len:204 (+) Transcript_10564:1105-1716(+)
MRRCAVRTFWAHPRSSRSGGSPWGCARGSWWLREPQAPAGEPPPGRASCCGRCAASRSLPRWPPGCGCHTDLRRHSRCRSHSCHRSRACRSPRQGKCCKNLVHGHGLLCPRCKGHCSGPADRACRQYRGGHAVSTRCAAGRRSLAGHHRTHLHAAIRRQPWRRLRDPCGSRRGIGQASRSKTSRGHLRAPGPRATGARSQPRA